MLAQSYLAEETVEQGRVTIFVRRPHCTFICALRAKFRSKRQNQGQSIRRSGRMLPPSCLREMVHLAAPEKKTQGQQMPTKKNYIRKSFKIIIKVI